jgi:uncharacterized protein YqhQ
MASFQYGGQALIEGVMMRGRYALSVALRHPDGTILWAVERLDMGMRASRSLRWPFLRGLVVLYDTLVTGTRWLVRAATLQAMALEAAEVEREAAEKAAKAAEAPEAQATASEAAKAAEPANTGAQGKGPGPGIGSILTTLALAPAAFVIGAASSHGSGLSDPDAPATPPRPAGTDQSMGTGYKAAVGLMLLLSLGLGVALFFMLPLLLAQGFFGYVVPFVQGEPAVGQVDQNFGFQLAEGLIRVALFVGYLMLTARVADVRRTFQYHGAEHMSIHTFEHGDPLTVDAARRYPTAHPRCGTEFLVVVLIVSILAFALVGKLPPLLLIGSRVVLIPVIAAISYEILQLGARHRRHAIVRWLWSPGIWVQMITTRQPTDDMIEVAIVSLERALVANGAEIPTGSTMFECRPLDATDLEGTPEQETGPVAGAPGAEAPSGPSVAADNVESAPPSGSEVTAKLNSAGQEGSSAGTPKLNSAGQEGSSAGTPKLNSAGQEGSSAGTPKLNSAGTPKLNSAGIEP